MTNRKFGKNSTFCFTALDSKHRLRYPLVSLFFGMCLTFWARRGVWDNLFHIKFVCSIWSGCGRKICMARQCSIWQISARLAQSEGRRYLFRPCRGAARCALAPPFHGTWFVETVLLNRQSNTSLGPGRRSMKNANRIFEHLGHVFVNCARSARHILISACQFIERYSLVVLVGPLCPGKLF